MFLSGCNELKLLKFGCQKTRMPTKPELEIVGPKNSKKKQTTKYG